MLGPGPLLGAVACFSLMILALFESCLESELTNYAPAKALSGALI